MNIKSVLKKSILELRKAGILTPELDVRILLEHSLKKDTIFLYSNPSQPLTDREYGRFRRDLCKRKKDVPIAYITGHKEFFGYDFSVNKNVLIPRPESEWLVEQAIQNIDYRLSIIEKTRFNNSRSRINILDLGTGSGCIIISLIKELVKKQYSNIAIEQFDFYASDISTKALNIAKKNAEKILFEVKDRELNKFLLRSSNIIKFFHSDLFSNKKLPKKYDLIIANLPYVPTSCKLRAPSSELKASILFEPQNAIFADDNNGTAIIKEFLNQAKDRINTNGLILIELDHRNANGLQRYAKKVFPSANIKLEKDLAKLDRYLILEIRN